MGFKFLNKGQDLFDADGAEDLILTPAELTKKIAYFEKKLINLSADADIIQRIDLLLEIASINVEQYQGKKAWDTATKAFDFAILNCKWELATKACNIMFLSESPDALKALGHAIWLGVSCPIDCEITVAVLQHLIDESPREADTRAIAAATAQYISVTRCGENNDITFFTEQMLAGVAKAHSKIDNQRSFDLWRKTLELNKPEIFLKKLAIIIDNLVSGGWWFDRNTIRQKFNEN